MGRGLAHSFGNCLHVVQIDHVMNTDPLYELLSSKRPLPAGFRGALERVLRPALFPKGHQLVQAQSAAHHAYFLQKGFAVSFQYRGNKRVVTDFWKSGQIILSPRSFFEQLPTDEIIQLATNSELLSMSYLSFQELSERFLVANYLTRDLTAHYHERSIERIVDLHTMDSWQRYLKLLNGYPGLEHYVSQDIIASYLNIAPPSLSRLKAEHYRSDTK